MLSIDRARLSPRRAPRPRPPATAAHARRPMRDRRRAPPSTMPGRIRRRARGDQRRSAPTRRRPRGRPPRPRRNRRCPHLEFPAQRAAGIPERGDGAQPVAGARQHGVLAGRHPPERLGQRRAAQPRDREALRRVPAAHADQISAEAEGDRRHRRGQRHDPGPPRGRGPGAAGSRDRSSRRRRGRVSTSPRRSSAAPSGRAPRAPALDQPASAHPSPGSLVSRNRATRPARSSSVAMALFDGGGGLVVELAVGEGHQCPVVKLTRDHLYSRPRDL